MVATAILGGACLSPDSMPRRALRGVTGPRRSRVGVVVALVGIQLGRPAGRPAAAGPAAEVDGGNRPHQRDQYRLSWVLAALTAPPTNPFAHLLSQAAGIVRPRREHHSRPHSHGVVRSRCRPIHDVRCEAVHLGDTACGQEIRCTRRRGESLRSRGWGPVRPSGSGGGSLPNSHRRWPCMPQFACRVRQSVLAHLLEEGLGAGGWVRLPGSARVVVSGSDLHRCASHCSHSRPTHDQ